MTVGVPGAGIGGLFYLASALTLPVRAALRSLRGEPVAWGSVWRQAALAAAMLIAIWAAGWLIGLWAGPQARILLPGVGGRLVRSTTALASAAMYTSLLTLGAVLLVVQVARFLARRQVVRQVS